MPDISDEERAERQRAVDFARGSVQLSGGGLAPEVEALNARYVAGELSGEEHVAAVIAHARTFHKGEPVQEYFTSAGDAMKATPDR
ncbi:antitoxin VbhA family protein [Sphingomonas sp. BAUL-RG-20F-R05-02]|uniref:antitoxin VbhA family protein n=1 Tax=Sphingomonas sp. BAUL-RG-20F-R05-02 TaxID=2914830 RepID=UPI001F571260|nr:antitoxin VbhA family protein [Sphingomonas sp. BAUL-RG-20F-R05-02]